MIALYKYPEQGVQEVSAGSKEAFHGKVLLPNWKWPRLHSEGIQAGMERRDLGHHSCEGPKRSRKGKNIREISVELTLWIGLNTPKKGVV